MKICTLLSFIFKAIHAINLINKILKFVGYVDFSITFYFIFSLIEILGLKVVLVLLRLLNTTHIYSI